MGLDTPKSFAQRSLVIFGVVKRGIEDHDIKLCVLERKTIQLCLKSGKAETQRVMVVCRSSQPILQISNQIDGYRAISSPGKLEAQPTIAGSEIKHSLSVRQRIEYPANEEVVAPGANFPLAAVVSGRILMRESKVIAFIMAAATFSSPNAFVIANELCIVSDTIRSERKKDPAIFFHDEVA
jgi:hypothetical protein